MLLYSAHRGRGCLKAGTVAYRLSCLYPAATASHHHHHHSLAYTNLTFPCVKRHYGFLYRSSSKLQLINPNTFTYCKIRLYSDFKDDETVKSWMKEIKQDFENQEPDKVKSSENYFKGIENEAYDKKLVKVPDSVNLENLSVEQQQSLIKLASLANSIVESEIQNDEDSSSDSDLLSSSSDSDSDSDSSDDEKGRDHHAEGFTNKEMLKLLKDSELFEHNKKGKPGAVQGFTKEEMIQMLKDSKVSEVETSDEDEDIVSHGDDLDHVEDDTSEKPKASLDDSGLAATRMVKDKLKEDWAVVEIEDFVNIEPEPEVEAPWVPPVSLERGKLGIFDVEDIVTLLQSANAYDIVVLRIPPEAQLADHMVIASVKSQRHLKALSKDIQFIYKKRANKRSAHLRVEGEGSQWHAMDIGNIFLHLFMPQERELYDLETLWTVGPIYDEKSRTQEVDPYTFSADQLPWLKELEEGQKQEKESDEHRTQQEYTVKEREKL